MWNGANLSALTEEQILAWAVTQHLRTGAWPTEDSGPVAVAPGEVWTNLDMALRNGGCGLPGNSWLARLIAARCSVFNQSNAPPLEQILEGADAHFRRTGQWPKLTSGPFIDAPGEAWVTIDTALLEG